KAEDNKEIKPDFGMEKLVVIASSTGGPKALSKVISKLDGQLDAPVVVVQHMPAGFTDSLAARLDEISEVKVKEAEDGDELCKGVVYIARGGRHLKVERKNGKGILRVYDGPAVVGLKPCADITVESLNEVGYDSILFVVMTGMGQDGTKGLLSLKKTIKKKVVAQDQKTSAVFGMPKAVINAKLADEVLALDKISKEINQTTGVRKHGC
ncbi:MAG: chemotaxis protein CheB, partial [Lachnospiraceae bacterium]|nr:chemotaxis protein CheB [Lachnospiraceae bacterium]